MTVKIAAIAACISAFPACHGEPSYEPLVLHAERDATYRITGSWTREAVGRTATPLAEAFTVSGFGHIADVVGHDSGFAVLDRMEKRIVLFDSSGTRTGEFGHAGKGPGEFSDPIAIVFSGAEWVVWDLATRAFSVHDPAGSALRTIQGPVSGDWAPNITRRGVTRWDHPFQAPDENMADYLIASEAGSFLHLLHDEPPRTAERERYQPGATVIRYDAGRGADTVFVLSGPVTIRRPRNPRIGADRFLVPLLAGRPLVASGSGWLTVAHGDSGTIRIVHGTGEQFLLSLPVASRAITEVDRLALADVILRHQAETTNAAGRLGGREVERLIDHQRNAFADEIPFAPLLPQVSALLGWGDCLWINVPAAAASLYFGQSPYWLGFNVRDRQLAGAIEVPDENALVRAFDRTRVYASRISANLEPVVVVYEIPQAEMCQGAASPAIRHQQSRRPS